MSNYPTHPTPPSDHLAPEELSALLDGEVEGARAQEMESHMRACAQCRDERKQLDGVRNALRDLVTSPPERAAGMAAEAAIKALEDDSKPGGRRVANEVSQLRRRQRLRVAGIAASVVLAAGGATGVVLAASHGGASSSAGGVSTRQVGGGAGGPASHKTPAALPTSSGSRAALQLRRPAPGVRLGAIVVSLVRSEVTELTVATAPRGSFTATITLEPRHALTARQLEDLRSARTSAVVSGMAEGVVVPISRSQVEIAGLTQSGVDLLKQLLG